MHLLLFNLMYSLIIYYPIKSLTLVSLLIASKYNITWIFTLTVILCNQYINYPLS